MAYKQLLQQLSQELEKAHAAILAQRTEAAELREELKSSNAVALDLRSQLAECRQQMQTNSGNTFNPITSFLGAEYHDCQTQGRANLKRTPKPEYKTPAPEQKSEEIIFDLISDHGEEDLPVKTEFKHETTTKPSASQRKKPSVSFTAETQQTRPYHRVQKSQPKVSKPAKKTPTPLAMRQPPRKQITSIPANNTKRQPKPTHLSLAENAPFEFTLIACYTSPNKDTFDFFHSSDLPENTHITDFWELLNGLVDSWQAAAGAEWQWEFEKADARRRTARVCVSAKLAKRPTLWREGDDGHFACKECAGLGRPCFTWEGDAFWCLPLADEDRRLPVVEEKEVRYWINERDASEDRK